MVELVNTAEYGFHFPENRRPTNKQELKAKHANGRNSTFGLKTSKYLHPSIKIVAYIYKYFSLLYYFWACKNLIL